ncbi:MAG: hypothetical protein ABSB31_05600 [Dehalococcoidia bacterium]|jgi:hypothetical protein
MCRVRPFFACVSDKFGLFAQAVLGILISGGAAILLSHTQYYFNNYVFGPLANVKEWWYASMIGIFASFMVICLGLWGILAIQSRERRLDRESRENQTQRIIDAIKGTQMGNNRGGQE